MKKLYYVKREVMATSITAAIRAGGKVYEVAEANTQPEDAKKKIQFNTPPIKVKKRLRKKKP